VSFAYRAVSVLVRLRGRILTAAPKTVSVLSPSLAVSASEALGVPIVVPVDSHGLLHSATAKQRCRPQFMQLSSCGCRAVLKLAHKG
jgi:hypothetical protein